MANLPMAAQEEVVAAVVWLKIARREGEVQGTSLAAFAPARILMIPANAGQS